MNKAKKIAVVGAVLAGTAIGMVGCGEVYVSFNGYDNIEKWQYNKGTFLEDIDSQLAGVTRAGYKVEGVYLDADFTRPVSNIAEVKGDVTLYIKWELADITIRFDANGGVGNIAEQTIKYTQSARLNDAANAFTKTGHKFTGWNTKSDGTGKAYSNGALFNMDSTSTVTLYAQYNAQPYTVNYNKNSDEATGTIANSQVTFGTEFSVTNKTFDRVGYDFVGWNTKADGTGAQYNAGDKITLTQEGVTLYAMWSARSFDIVYDKASDEATGTIAGLDSVKYNSMFLTSEGGYTRVGYGLAGWSTEPNGQGVRFGLGDNVVLNVVPTSGDTITLYAIWEANPSVTADDLYKTVTMDSQTYDLAMVVGKSYSFDTVDVESITNASEDGVATISNGVITINKAGTFTVCLAEKEDNAVKFNYTVVAMGTDYSISYWNMDDANNPMEIKSSNVGGYQFMDMAAYNTYTSYTYNDGYKNGGNLPGIIKAGHDVALALADGAYIGGVWTPAGTIVTSLPAKTFGDIKLKVVGTPKDYSYRFNVWDSENHYADSTVTITAKYGTSDWTTATGYTAELNNPGAIDGYIFAGWYISNSDYSEEKKFDGKFDNPDSPTIDVYARYIKISDLAIPANVAVSNAQIISWNEVTAPTGFDVQYMVVIGTDEYTTNTNSFDASTIIAYSGEYTITVSANYTISNTAINFATSQIRTSAEIRYEYTKANNGIVRVNVGDETVKLVMYTDMKYEWKYSDKDSSNLITIETEDKNLVKYNKTVKGNTATVTITTTSNTGTFYMIQGEKRRLVEVVENITAVSVGESYSNYVNSTGESSTFLDKAQMSVSGDYLVGTGNAFKFDVKLYRNSETESGYSTTFDMSNEEYTTFVFEVETGEDNWVNADGLYYYPAKNTFSTTLESGGIATKVTRNGEEFTFNEGLDGVRYRATMYLTYSRAGNTTDNITLVKQGDRYVLADTEQVKDNKCTFVFTINNGVNVYTSDELKAAYGNFDIHCINIHRDIKATLDYCQMQANGSPINVQSDYVYDNADTTSNNASDGVTGRKTDGNIFKRVSRNAARDLGDANASDLIIVNGNYCSVDAYDVAPINVYGSAGSAGSDGINGCTGTQVCLGYEDYIRPQTGIFRYQVPYNNSTAIFNSINIEGNRKGEKVIKLPEVTDPNYSKMFHRMDVMNSGSLVGIFNENSRIMVNNCNFTKVYHAVRSDSAGDSVDYAGGRKSTSEFNYCKITGTYDAAIYGWNIYEARVFNSVIENSDGPAISFSDTFANKPILYLDKNTVVDNFVEGTGGFFAKWNLSQIAAKFKSQLQGTVSDWGYSVLQNKSNSEMFNFVFCYNPSEAVGDPDAPDYFKNYGVNTNVGGTKVLCDAADPRSIGNVYDESGNIIAGYYFDGGVSTVADNMRNMDFLSSKDDRVRNGMYAFAETDAVSTDAFAALINGTTTLLTEMASAADVTKTNAIRYAGYVQAMDMVTKMCKDNNVAVLPEDIMQKAALTMYSLGSNATQEAVIAGLKSMGVTDEELGTYGASLQVLMINYAKTLLELFPYKTSSPFVGRNCLELCLNAYDADNSQFVGNPCANVSDANVLKLVEEIIIANTTTVIENGYTEAIVKALKDKGMATTVTNYLLAKGSDKLVTYLMFRLGYDMSVGNNDTETMIQVAMPFGTNAATGESSSYKTPLVVISTTGSAITNEKWSMNIPAAPQE